MSDTWGKMSVGLIATCGKDYYRVPFGERKTWQISMQLLYHTDSPVLMYASLLRHPLIYHETVQVFGVPLPTFLWFFFSLLWIKQIIFFFQRVCGLLTRARLCNSPAGCTHMFCVNVWLGTHLQSWHWLDLRVWSCSNHVTLRLTDPAHYIFPPKSWACGIAVTKVTRSSFKILYFERQGR